MTSSSTERKKVLILNSSGGSISDYGLKILEQIFNDHAQLIIGIAVCKDEKTVKKSSFKGRWRKFNRRKGVMLFNKIFRLLKLVGLVKRNWKYQSHIIDVDFEKEFGITPIILPSVNSSETVAEIKALSADIIFHIGGKILRQPIIDAANIAILGYHHGDLTKYRGPFQGFWELYNNDSEAGVTLQTLEPTLDTGKIVLMEYFPIDSSTSLLELQKTLNEESVHMASDGIQKLIENPNHGLTNYQIGPYRSFPGFFQIMKLVFKKRI